MPRFSPDLIISCLLHFSLSKSQEAPARIAPPASQLKAAAGAGGALVPLLSVSPSPYFPGPRCSCSHSCVSPGSGEPYLQLPRDWHQLPPLALPCFSHSFPNGREHTRHSLAQAFCIDSALCSNACMASYFLYCIQRHLPKAAFPAHSLYNSFPTISGLCVLFVP